MGPHGSRHIYFNMIAYTYTCTHAYVSMAHRFTQNYTDMRGEVQGTRRRHPPNGILRFRKAVGPSEAPERVEAVAAAPGFGGAPAPCMCVCVDTCVRTCCLATQRHVCLDVHVSL